jgi:pimeloyl-ACP methyl ester carboxylesterase
LVCLSLIAAGKAFCAEPSAAEGASPPLTDGEGLFNVVMATTGGKQLWTDELLHSGWRVQRHVLTGHCRLLDDRDRRMAWGDFEHCRRSLEDAKRKLVVPPMRGKVVIALHGVIRTSASMAGLCEFLERDGGYTTLNMSYASTRGDLSQHASALAQVVNHLDDKVTEVNFVAHSLGNLVIRRYLADCYAGRNGLTPDRRLNRIVMLAPPNNGAQFAEFFKDSRIVKWLWGDSVQQIAAGPEALQKELAIPRGEFGILAGGRGASTGGNWWLDGDDDMVVSVEETKLPGARDFAVVPNYHGKIMDDDTARRYVLSFLQHGYFVSEMQRRPLPVAAAVNLPVPLDCQNRPLACRQSQPSERASVCRVWLLPLDLPVADNVGQSCCPCLQADLGDVLSVEVVVEHHRVVFARCGIDEALARDG